jgi:hypothetical protein
MQLIYATMKRKVVSPVNMLVEHWLLFPNLVGDISCTSLITWIANDLGIIWDATIISIDTPCEIISYNYFSQARWVKKIQEKLHYIHNKSAIPLPNPGLGIYSVQSFLINKQAQLVQQQPPRTSARASSSNYAGADPLHQDVAYQSYENFVLTYPRRAYQGRDLPSQGPSLEVADFTHHLWILYLPIIHFQDSTISILRRSAKVSITTWVRKWARRTPTPTCYANNNSWWTRQDND